MVAAVVLCVGAGAVTLSIFRRISDRRAYEAVQKHGELAARIALAPLVTEAFLDHRRPAVDTMRNASTALKQYGGATAITIATDAGLVVWADDPDVVGSQMAVPHWANGDDEWATTGMQRYIDVAPGSAVEVSSVIDMHTRIETMQGVPMVITVSYPIDGVSSQGPVSGDELLPVVAGGLLLLTAILVPYSLSAPRQSRRQRHERERLLERLTSSSDAERRRIAGEVHDGAVQELVGVSFTLGAVANDAPAPLDERLRELADTTRTTVTGLRSLLNSIYPVQVPATGWLAGLDDLVAAMRDAGIAVDSTVPTERYAPLNELLMLRVAREALRNVAAHAEAQLVSISVQRTGSMVRLQIADDGVGFEQGTDRAQREAGHFGLQLVRDLACEMGATLTVDSTPGSGTVVTLELKEGK
jgi:signal transduction histidine kinase